MEGDNKAMNIDLYKRILYASRSESNLKDELELLRAIDAYDTRNCIGGLACGKLQVLVDWIYTTRPDRNEVSNERVAEMFQLTDYQMIRLAKEMAYYVVGKKWSINKDLHDLKDLAFIEENMGHGFYLGLEIDRDVLSEQTNMVDATNELFLLKCRSMEVDREHFVQFCKKELADELPNEEVIKKIGRYNDGAYLELPSGIHTLGVILLRENALDIWCNLLVKLHYFPIQGALIYSLKTVEQCLDVWELLSEKNYQRFKVLAYLLRERMMRLLAKESDLLARNAQSDLLEDEDRKYGQQLYASWTDNKPKYVERMVGLWLETFGAEEIAGWYSNVYARLESIKRNFITNELQSAKLVGEYLTPVVVPNKDAIANADYQTLLYYMEIAMQRELKGDVCKDMAERLCHLTYNERYIPLMKLEERTFETLRHIYYCIFSSGIDGLSMMIRERYPMEGFVVNWDLAFRSCSADSIWLSALLLQIETIEDRGYFWKVVECLYRLANYEKSTVTDYYFMPFYIAEIIAIQIIPDQKDEFEAMMIGRVSNLHFLLRVLTANEGELSKANKVALKFRCDREWYWEKQLISQQLKEQTDYLDEYVRKTVEPE